MSRQWAYYGRNNSYSMSQGAEDAYQRGLCPASKVGHGIPSALISQYCKAVEWHHTGKTAQRTKFYDVEDVLTTFGKGDGPGEPDAVAALAASRHKAPTVLEHQDLHYSYWERETVNRFGKLGWRLYNVDHQDVTLKIASGKIEVLSGDKAIDHISTRAKNLRYVPTSMEVAVGGEEVDDGGLEL